MWTWLNSLIGEPTVDIPADTIPSAEKPDHVVDSPPQGCVGGHRVVPNDSKDIHGVRGIYVGGSGHVKVTTLDGSIVTFTSVPAGSVLPVYIKKIHRTGTTATNIIGLL